MAFEFLTELHEARMTRNADNQRRLTYADCRERAYLTLLMLQVMRYFPSHRITAAKYAYKTVMYRDYTRFRVDGSDLYNLFYFITGDDSALDKLKDPAAAKEERKRTFLSVGRLNGYLRSLGSANGPTPRDYEILSLLERELGIRNNDYKEIRRRLVSFDTDTPKERQTTVTRLLFAGRTKLTDGDFLHQFTALVQDKNLENFKLTSPEPTLSTPDNPPPADELRNYRFLVPANSIPFIGKFLQSARTGRTIMANFTQSYLPIIIMIDDIVRAGPSYIEQLKQVHKRAKRDLNR
jgi:hypothetical protein